MLLRDAYTGTRLFQTNAVSSVRFACFFAQVIGMMWMGFHVAISAL